MKKVIYVPTITAFDKNQKLDLKANKRVIDFLIKAGVDGLVPLGSTGEFTAFSFEQRKSLIELYANEANGKVDVLAGSASMDFDETVKLTDFIYSLGLKGALVLMPYYFGANQENIYEYYSTLANKTKCDIYIYNYPGRTTCDVAPETVLRLLKNHKNIKGIKDTVGDVAHTKTLAKIVLKEFVNFEIYSGYDDQFCDNITYGGAGCISGLSNIAPDIWVSLVKSANEKNFDNIVKYANALAKLMDIYALDVNFSLIFKKLLKYQGIDMEERAIFPYNSIKEGKFQKAVEILQQARELAK